MSFNYPHKDILDTYFEVHMAWQNRQFDWTDPWASIDERLKTARSRFIMIPQAHASRKPGNPGNPARPAAPGAAPKKQGKPPINGVPRSFMQSKNICMNFNDDACHEKGSHKNKYNEKVTLQHICAGCHKVDGSKTEHSVAGCRKHDFASLF